MSGIFSFNGFSGTAPSLAGRSVAGVQKNSARLLIMDQLVTADPDKAAKAEEKIAKMQHALEQMQQARQDMTAARKEAAKQKVARIKAQIQALKMMGGDAEANARKLARLARELSSAVRDYKAAGGSAGTAGVSVAMGAAAPPEGMHEMTTMSAVSAPASAAGSEPDLEMGQEDEGDQENDAGTAKAASSEDAEFAKEMLRLRRQIEAMLETEKRRMALEQGKPGNRDTRTAEVALREAERQVTAIENPIPSINIEI